MSRCRWIALLFGISLVVSGPLNLAVQAQPKPADKEVQLRYAVASALADLADFARVRTLHATAKKLADEALEVSPDHKQAKQAQGKISGDDSGAKDADKDAFQKRAAADNKKIAKAYLQLFAYGATLGAKEAPRFEAYLERAYRLDSKTSRAILDSEVANALKQNDMSRAHRLLTLAEQVEPDKTHAAKLREVELKLAETTAVVRKAKNHDLRYYLMLPKGWDAAKKWPVIVTVEGAGSNFSGNIAGLAGARGNHPFILMCPCSFSNTNDLDAKRYPWYSKEILEAHSGRGLGRLKFDEEGTLAALKDLREEFNAEDKFYITGFSGGGHLTYCMIFAHPDMLAAAAPGCGNFSAYDSQHQNPAPERESLPIKAFQGDKDEYLNDINGSGRGLNQEWAEAESMFKQLGYKNFERKMLPGVGHSGCHKEVIEFFVSLKK